MLKSFSFSNLRDQTVLTCTRNYQLNFGEPATNKVIKVILKPSTQVCQMHASMQHNELVGQPHFNCSSLTLRPRIKQLISKEDLKINGDIPELIKMKKQWRSIKWVILYQRSLTWNTVSHGVTEERRNKTPSVLEDGMKEERWMKMVKKRFA